MATASALPHHLPPWLRFTPRLFRGLTATTVPAAPNGSVWMPASYAGQALMDEFYQRHADSGLRHLTKATFFAGGKPRYIKPADLGYELPTGGRPEVAFAGRSNVGKSSLLGALIGQPSLCRRSKRPGCTTTVNYFEINTGTKRPAYLVDLPGYGFARRREQDRQAFGEAATQFLASRDRTVLRHVVLLIDARRGFELKTDKVALEAFDALRVSHHVVITKADLAPPPELASALHDIFQIMPKMQKGTSTWLPFVHVVSSKTGFGVPELRDYVASFLEPFRAPRPDDAASWDDGAEDLDLDEYEDFDDDDEDDDDEDDDEEEEDDEGDRR